MPFIRIGPLTLGMYLTPRSLARGPSISKRETKHRCLRSRMCSSHKKLLRSKTKAPTHPSHSSNPRTKGKLQHLVHLLPLHLHLLSLAMTRRRRKIVEHHENSMRVSPLKDHRTPPTVL